MKFIYPVVLLVLSTFLLSAGSQKVSANELEDKINEHNDFVVITDVTYGGLGFLANTARERSLNKDLAGIQGERARQICSFMGYHTPAAFQVAEGYVRRMNLLSFHNGNLLSGNYESLYEGDVYNFSFFKSISCQR